MYKCFCKKDELKLQPFAVKITREDDEEKKQASRNEFILTKKMNHPNLMKSIEFFQNEFSGEMHTVMEYVEGQEL